MIDQLESITINDSKQWLLYRSQKDAAPVVLFVHGGPGYPQMWFSRAFDKQLIKDFTVVHWDQRSAGKSYERRAPIASYQLQQIALDGVSVAEHLCQKFGTNQILLVGHSWGTMVGAAMSNLRPDLFKAFVSVGTCVDWVSADQYKFAELEKLAKETQDEELFAELLDIRKPPYSTHDQMARLADLWINFKGFGGTCRKLSEEQLGEAIIQSTEYSDAEIERALDALRRVVDVLAPDLVKYNAFKEVPKIAVPVVFVQGTYDNNTPTDLARSYFEKLEAPKGKNWIEFKDSAHMPMYEEPELFVEVLRKLV
jgi:pimeloyl-ACP methyl ester carboxylesterase